MKNTIQGFNQSKLVEFGLDSDDALILRWFVDFKDSNKMTSKIIDDEKYYWIKYEGILEDLPILRLKTKDALYRRLKKMDKCQILKHKTVKENGTYSFYALGINYVLLIVDLSEINPNPTEINPIGYGNKSVGGTEMNPEQKINLLNNTNLLNNNKKKKKETSIDVLISQYTSNNFLKETIIDFMKMRKSIKKPLTDRALKGILNKLDKLGSTDEIKIKILENSIENCWQGVFPLKSSDSSSFKKEIKPEVLDAEQMKPVSQADLDEIEKLEKELDEMGDPLW